LLVKASSNLVLSDGCGKDLEIFLRKICYGDLIEEHLRGINELENCRQLLNKQTSKK